VFPLSGNLAKQSGQVKHVIQTQENKIRGAL
jgi:hypothetical protein